MIKPILTVAIIATSLFSFGQSFSAKYNFALTNTTTPSTTDPTPPPTVTGITFGSFSAVGVGTVSTSNGSFTYDTWGLGAQNGTNTPTSYTGNIDLGMYYGVTITPNSGYQVTLNDMTFTSRRSSTGPRQYAIRSGNDSYTNNLPASSTNTNVSIINANEFFFNQDNSNTYTGNTITFTDPSFSNFTTPVNIRFYAWNAESTAGSFRIDSVIFNGSVSITTNIGNVSFDLNSGINVYPMPNHDGIIYIDNNISDLNKIEVFDILGNLIATQSINNDNKKLKLNLSELNTGNYFIRFTANNKISTKKIAIIK